MSHGLVVFLLAVGCHAGVRTSRDGEEPRTLYQGSQVLRAFAVSQDQREALLRLEETGDADMWSSPASNRTTVDLMVQPSQLEKVKDYLFNANIAFDVMIEDLQEAIDEENPMLSEEEMELLEGRNGHRMTWLSYHRVNDMHHYLDYLANTYPQLCSVVTIGSSVEGRALKVLKISNGGQGNPAIWIDGGVHAREWVSPAVVSYIINELVENRDNHGPVVEKLDWYLLPISNPDGYEYSHLTNRMWRKNRANSQNGRCAGTDLNRNFGYHWAESGASKDPCSEVFAGTRPFSEPESRSISNFIKSNSRSIKAYVSFHSYGQYILYPWGYDRRVPPDYTDLQRVGKQAARAIRAAEGPGYTVGSSAATLYPASGGSDDWAKGSAKVKYAYTIELRDTGRHGFILPSKYIIPTGKEALAAVKTIAEAALSA